MDVEGSQIHVYVYVYVYPVQPHRAGARRQTRRDRVFEHPSLTRLLCHVAILGKRYSKERKKLERNYFVIF